MSRYSEFTADLGDRLTDVIARAEDTQVDLLQRLRGGVRRVAGERELPEIPGSDRLPSARDILQANFALAQRLLDANRRYTMSLLEALTGSAPKRKSKAKAKAKKAEAASTTEAA